MGVRLRSTYYSNKNLKYTLEIHDKEHVLDFGHIFEMPEEGNPAYFYENDEVNIFSEVAAVNLSFTMWIDNADHESFFEDLATSAEGRFFVKLIHIHKPTPITEQQIVKFYGKLTHDLLSLEESAQPTLTLNAQDGLMELDTLEYDGGIFSLRYAFIIIKECLLKSSAIEFFYDDDNDHIIHVYNEYKSELEPSAEDMFEYTYVNNYFKKDIDGQPISATCLEVLREILRGLGARIYFSDGVYHIEQVRTRLAPSSSFSVYRKDGTQDGTGSGGNDITQHTSGINFHNQELTILGNPIMTIIPPVRSVILSQDGSSIDNLLFGYEYGHNISTGQLHIGNVSVLDENLKVYCKLNFNPWILKTEQYVDGWPKFGYAVFDVQIKIGNKNLLGTTDKVIIANPGNQGNTLQITDELLWSTNSTARVRIAVPAYIFFVDLQNNAADQNYLIDIVSPEIEEIGDIHFNIEHIDVYKDAALETTLEPSLPLFWDLKWQALSNSITILQNLNDTNTGGTTIHTILNDANNTIIYRTDYDMIDAPGTQDVHRLMIRFSEDSTEWSAPGLGVMPFQLLAINDIVSIRRVPRRRYEMNMCLDQLNRPLSFRDRLIYRGRIFIPLTMEVFTALDEFRVLWFEISADTSSLPPTQTSLPATRGGFLGTTIATSSLQGNGNDTYYKYVDSITDDYVDVSDYELLNEVSSSTEDSVRASWTVHLGGNKMRYRKVPQSDLGQGEFTIDIPNQKLLWRRNFNGRKAEIKIENRYIVSNPSS